MANPRNQPVNSPRSEAYTGDMELGHQGDVDLSLDSRIIHGEALANLSEENKVMDDYRRMLAFMEEPVTIRIDGNTSEEHPETHVPVGVNGTDAEVMQNGRWLRIGWLPIGVELITKRKYLEVLMRSKPDTVRTQHEEATVERPRNTVTRHQSRKYPLSILNDSAEGHEWATRVMRST